MYRCTRITYTYYIDQTGSRSEEDAASRRVKKRPSEAIACVYIYIYIYIYVYTHIIQIHTNTTHSSNNALLILILIN